MQLKSNNLYLISRSELDISKWDACVSAADRCTLYGKSWFLDIVSQGKWKGIVLKDYEAVMSLTDQKKLFYHINHPPLLSRNNGPFCPAGMKPDVFPFYEFLRDRFSRVEIFTTIPVGIVGYTPHNRTNHIISLADKTTNDITGAYCRNTKRNIKSALSQNVYIKEIFNIKEIESFLTQNEPTGYFHRNTWLLTPLLSAIKEKNKGQFFGAFRDDRLIATGIFIVEDDRVYFIICSSNGEGKELKAMYLLIDHAIKHYHNLGLSCFDFTGSNIPSIARRNKSFGAEDEIFYHYTYSTLLLTIVEKLKKGMKRIINYHTRSF